MTNRRTEGNSAVEDVEPVPGVDEADRSADAFRGVTIQVKAGGRAKRLPGGRSVRGP